MTAFWHIPEYLVTFSDDARMRGANNRRAQQNKPVTKLVIHNAREFAPAQQVCHAEENYVIYNNDYFSEGF